MADFSEIRNEALPQDIKEIFEQVKGEYPDIITNQILSLMVEWTGAFKKAGVETVEFATEDNEKLGELAEGIWKEYVDKLEEQGLPGRECFNSLQDIIAKHVSGYEPIYM